MYLNLKHVGEYHLGQNENKNSDEHIFINDVGEIMSSDQFLPLFGQKIIL